MSTDDEGLNPKLGLETKLALYCLEYKGELISRDQEVEAEVSRQSPVGLIYVTTGTPGTGSIPLILP